MVTIVVTVTLLMIKVTATSDNNDNDSNGRYNDIVFNDNITTSKDNNDLER